MAKIAAKSGRYSTMQTALAKTIYPPLFVENYNERRTVLGILTILQGKSIRNQYSREKAEIKILSKG